MPEIRDSVSEKSGKLFSALQALREVQPKSGEATEAGGASAGEGKTATEHGKSAAHAAGDHSQKATSEHGGGEHGAAEHGGGEHAKHKVLVTNPQTKDVTITTRYVCQIRSRKHIEIRALNEGYLQDVLVKEGEAVKEGSVLFTIIPVLYQARLDSDMAEAQLAQVEYDNTKRLVEQKIVSIQQLKLIEAKLAKTKANVELARAELEFARIKAPFDGIIDRLHEQKGSLLEEGAILTTLSDNSVMWVYFNVTETQYLDFKETLQKSGEKSGVRVELELANHKLFPHPGVIGAIEADFNNETGTIPFRADFPNPDWILRHGQTGTILMSHEEHNALVIPQRATFEVLAKLYVFVVDENNTVRQQEINVQHEQDDIFVIASGLKPTDRIVFEGQRQVRDGDVIEYEFQSPEQVLSNLKYHAE